MKSEQEGAYIRVLGEMLFLSMLREVLFLFALSFSTLTGFSQYDGDSVLIKSIELMDESALSKKKRMALVETDTVLIASSFDMLISTLKDRIKEYEVEEDKQLLRKLFSTSKSLERNLIDISNTPVLKARLEFCVIDLIQKGKVVIYNKTTKAYEDEILLAHYHQQWWTGVKVMTVNNESIMNVRTGSY